jgi:hypothetical protein
MANVIHYVDMGDFYTVYGIATLIVILLLLWYFVRSNLEEEKRPVYNNLDCMNNYTKSYSTGHLTETSQVDKKDDDTSESMLLDDISENFPEFKCETSNAEMAIPKQKKIYQLKSGTYGDVPVNVYDIKDIVYANEWVNPNEINIPNMRTSFRDVSSTIRAGYWLV